MAYTSRAKFCQRAVNVPNVKPLMLKCVLCAGGSALWKGDQSTKSIATSAQKKSHQIFTFLKTAGSNQ